MRHGESVRTEVLQVCTALNTLAISKSELFLSLLAIAHPNLPEIYSVASVSGPHLFFPLLPSLTTASCAQEVLGLAKWFEKKDDAAIREAMEHGPSDAVAFRVFWSVRQLVVLLNRMSVLQLLHLSEGLIPPGTEEAQTAFVAGWQQELQHWSTEKVRELHGVIHSTPVHLERQRLSGVVRPELASITLSVLKLPLDQLVAFHAWFCGLGPALLRQLVQLLTGMSSPQLIDLRSMLLLPSHQHGAQEANQDLLLARVPMPARDELVNSLMSGFSPDASYPTHNAGPMKVSVGSLDLGAIPMDLGFGEDDLHAHYIHRSDSDPLGLRAGGPSIFNRSDSDPFSQPRPPGSRNNSGNSLPAAGATGGTMGPPPPVRSAAPVAPPPGRAGTEKMSAAAAAAAADAAAAAADMDDGGDDEEYDDDSMMPPSVFQTQPSDGSPNHFQLRIVVQPSAKTVYQRILRPYPAVMLEGAAPGANFFVEVTLCTNDGEEPLSCLTGAAKTRISNGLYATFKKLKVNSTSQQIGSLLRLRFQLKSFNGTTFADVPDVTVFSNPIEVFSHTHYLSNKKKVSRFRCLFLLLC
jgi:hypothetical protein